MRSFIFLTGPAPDLERVPTVTDYEIKLDKQHFCHCNFYDLFLTNGV